MEKFFPREKFEFQISFSFFEEKTNISTVACICYKQKERKLRKNMDYLHLHPPPRDVTIRLSKSRHYSYLKAVDSVTFNSNVA